jgi:hypothetical protein
MHPGARRGILNTPLISPLCLISDKLLDNANWDAVETYKTTYLAKSDAYISPGGPTCDDDYRAASIKNSSSDCEVAAGERSCR